MFKRILAASLLLITFALVLSACGGEAAPTPGSTGQSSTPASGDAGTEVRIVTKDNIFEPKSYTVQGPAFRIVVMNEGSNVHEVEVKGLVPETQLVAGQSKSFDIADVKPGTYRIYCEIHEDEGMEGELIVK